MQEQTKDKIIFFLLGIFVGMGCTLFSGVFLYKTIKGGGISFSMPSVSLPVTNSQSQAAFVRKDFALSFENSSDLDMLIPEGSVNVNVSQEHSTEGSKSLMVQINPGGEYSGLSWEVYGNGVQNWKGANEFHMDVYNNTEKYVSLQLKFKSGRDYPKKSYSYSVELNPLAMNNIRIPLATIGNMCDLSSMSYFKMFLNSTDSSVVLFVDNVGTK